MTSERSKRRGATSYPDPAEAALQRATAELVGWALVDGATAFHVPNEREGKFARMNLAAAGVLPGVADWIILAPATYAARKDGRLVSKFGIHQPRLAHESVGRAYAIELKVGRRKQSSDQVKFEERCRRAAVPYCVVRSLDEFAETLRAWGLLRDGVEVE